MVIIKELLIENTLLGGNSSLTNEFIYNNSDNKDLIIPVFTGAKEFQNKYVNLTSIPSHKIFFGSDYTIKINRKGDVKFATIITEKKFTINDDAYIGYLNKQKIKELGITVNAFCGFIISNISKFSSSESGNGTFNKNSFLNSIFDIDNIKDYELRFKFYKNKFTLLKIAKLLKEVREVSINIPLNLEFAPITKLFKIHKGSSKYTEEYIYNNSDEKEDLIPLYTGALKFENKYINKSSINDIIPSPSIRILKDGVNSGISEVITDKSYVINSHALALTPIKPELDLNIYSFLLRTYIVRILNDPSGNPTLNTKEFEKISIPIIIKGPTTAALSRKILNFNRLEKIIYESL